MLSSETEECQTYRSDLLVFLKRLDSITDIEVMGHGIPVLRFISRPMSRFGTAAISTALSIDISTQIDSSFFSKECKCGVKNTFLYYPQQPVIKYVILL
jgi:hypothetical protein